MTLAITEEQSKSVTMQPRPCGYADLFVSKALGSKLLRVSLNGTIAVALLYLTRLDRFLAQKAGEMFVYLNAAEWYWVIITSISIVLLAVNFSSLRHMAREYRLDKNDWTRLKNHVSREREFRDLSNLKTNKIIKKSMPLYLLYIGILLGLFGILITVDTLFTSPIMKILTGLSDNADVFIFNYRALVSIYMFTLAPPYIFLLLVIYIKNFN